MMLTYPPTHRERQPTKYSSADVNHIYLAQIRALYAPVRTLDASHRPTTQTSTSFVPLLQQPRTTPQEVSHAIVTTAMNANLPQALQHSQLLVRSDALHIRRPLLHKTIMHQRYM